MPETFYPAVNSIINVDRLPDPVKDVINNIGSKLFYEYTDSALGNWIYVNMYLKGHKNKSTKYTMRVITYNKELENPADQKNTYKEIITAISDKTMNLFPNQLYSLEKVLTGAEFLRYTTFKTQKAWFDNLPNNNPRMDPKLSFVSMDWVLSYDRAKEVYDEILSEGWKSETALDKLREIINKQIINGDLILPTEANNNLLFGSFYDEIIEVGGEMVPSFVEETYYSRTSSDDVWDRITESLDDLYGTLGRYAFKLIATGELIWKSNEVYINILKLGVYVVDSFDFNDGDDPISQPLGFWDFKSRDVARYPSVFRILIQNSDYRDWRSTYDKGGDFKIYSDIKEVSKSLKIKLNS